MTGRRRNPVRTLFKVENLTPNSVIIVKQGCALDTPFQLKRMANELIKRDLGSVVVMKLASLDDFHSLTEEQMGKLGWIRKAKADA